jgi:hypothetical protein
LHAEIYPQRLGVRLIAGHQRSDCDDELQLDAHVEVALRRVRNAGAARQIRLQSTKCIASAETINAIDEHGAEECKILTLDCDICAIASGERHCAACLRR